MLNNRLHLLGMLLLVLLAGFSAPVFAQQAMPEQTTATPASELAPAPTAEAPAAAQPPAPAAGPPTVTNIIIDRTDKNAVVARDQAIIEAQRTAFETLAERSMTPDAFKAYKLPDNKTIVTLVRDFEMKDEQMSANRYVANFTVRFTPEINNYIKIPEGLETVVASAPPVISAPAPAATTTAPVASGTKTPPVAPATAPPPAAAIKTSSATPTAPSTTVPPAAAATKTSPRNVLVLPYFESVPGKKLLWEDPNPWRDAWEEAGNATPAPHLTISVPLGDLTDVSSGNTDDVWKGNYSTLEKLRVNYNADEIAVVVAHQPVAGSHIDIYLYKDGKFERKKSVSGLSQEADASRTAIARVIAAIRSPEPFETPPTSVQEKTTATAPEAPAFVAPVAAEKPASAPQKITIEAMVNFDNFAQWMEAQKRLAAVSPPLGIEISSLTKDSAQFTVHYDGGGLDALKTALAGKGIVLNPPVVDVGESVIGSDKPTQKTIYELRLQN